MRHSFPRKKYWQTVNSDRGVAKPFNICKRSQLKSILSTTLSLYKGILPGLWKSATSCGTIGWSAYFSIPWGHNALILEKIKDTAERLWYASKTIEHGWSRNMLTIWIENDLYRREGKAITNFQSALPATQSDLAQQSLLHNCGTEGDKIW